MKFKSALKASLFLLLHLLVIKAFAQETSKLPLGELQQKFVDLKFGMFIHFNIPTYFNQDWPDPEASPAAFNPTKLDADQWAKAAKSANMTYGCLTTKHHSGFCIWDTKTTDYNVMHSPYKKDVVRQFVNAFRANGLKVMLYYSILDTHHKLRPNEIQPKHIEMVKKQLTELLTNYGPIEALIIDGWDAPWSRISYDDVPFEQIYKLIKTLQPNCILMDLNGAKYPKDGLYYTDIKTYEMGAGQRMSKDINQMPSLACLPLQSSWFWKTNFPSTDVKNPAKLVEETIEPLNKANCNFILNVAPNRDGLFDDNAVAALKEIGKLWHSDGTKANFKAAGAPIIATNLAKHQPANSSWSDDMNIMDFANDDDFGSSWQSNPEVKNPWYEIDFRSPQTFNEIAIFEHKSNIKKYKLEYFANNKWNTLFDGEKPERVKLHRFDAIKGDKVRMQIETYDTPPSIAEFGIYNEPR
ncbi:alpha-L-fucosidase [Mucilaginibacter sp. SMC90]|uniref:alpha-L-fucosidase n=1 Tax=Mucilaginibacter sp. SMC90 TaxID=2929803 RepID=UPI001FB48734|nr:alpha-L-fucosidase [Mucilaginibacter sp. SMC90]UOE50837.1 alpha-L-fucosidase [Mucilaginibacter sp. SMC90]